MKKGDKVIIESSNEKGVVMYVNTTTNRAAVKMEDGTGRVFPFDVLKTVAKKYDNGDEFDEIPKSLKKRIDGLQERVKITKEKALEGYRLHNEKGYGGSSVGYELFNAKSKKDSVVFGNLAIDLGKFYSEKKYAKGGNSDVENNEMVLNNNNQIKHHTEELPKAIKGKKVPAWVVAKVNRSASDLSDASHYMDGQGDTYANGGRLTSNEDIIEAFLTSNREAKVGNLETTYSTLGAVVLLRNYGTLIAKRRGKTVSISNKKYSVTTTKIQNMIERIANRMGLKVEKIDENKFALGGNTSAFEYSIGGL
jgi:hypothetical protein